MNYHIPIDCVTKEQIFKYLKENKSLVMQQKKSAIKRCDPFNYTVPFVNTKSDFETKDIAATNDTVDTGFVLLKFVGNTTNLMDSHDDVHIPKLWNKTLSDNPYFLHLQEHEMEFEKVIHNRMTSYVKTVSWKSLNAPFEGSTQALFGSSNAPVERNPYMVDQYRKGYVENHSVGMRYVKIVLCINSEEKYYSEEKDNWDKYYPMVANKDRADSKGYFFAVLEAELIEISAVVKGSNVITPTISVTESKSSSTKTIEEYRKMMGELQDTILQLEQESKEAGKSTSAKIEPPKGTPIANIDYSQVKFI